MIQSNAINIFVGRIGQPGIDEGIVGKLMFDFTLLKEGCDFCSSLAVAFEVEFGL